MEITELEMVEVNTHLKMVNRAYQKFQVQRTAIETLESEFQDFFNFLVEQKGGDPNKQYQLDLENNRIIEQVEAPTEQAVSNNGQNPSGSFSDEVRAEVVPNLQDEKVSKV